MRKSVGNGSCGIAAASEINPVSWRDRLDLEGLVAGSDISGKVGAGFALLAVGLKWYLGFHLARYRVGLRVER